MMPLLNIANIVEATEAEGPGLRFVVWVQGCLKRCQGCCNPELLKIKPTHIFSSKEIIEQLCAAKKKYHSLEGITFLGGEPFLQAKGLADIAKYAHEIDLSVMVFTGYLLEDLTESQFFGSQNLLKYTDLLIDGEFDYTQQETIRNWVGSKNQNFHYLTPRYSEEIEVRRLTVTNEWRISSDGYIVSNGLPSKIAN